MAELRAPEVTAPSTAADDARIGQLLGGATEPRVVLVGFPSDEGVRRNGGRPGAAAAPDAIRNALYRMTPDARLPAFAQLVAHTRDLGNLVCRGDLERDQQSFAEALAPELAAGRFVIVLGGGHETGFAHFLAYAQAGMPIHIVNVDAHTDVRPLREGRGHSGSPFRQALEHRSRLCRGYHVAGLEAATVAAAHLELVKARGGRVLFRDDEADWDAFFATSLSPAMASFDMDAVAAADAPGVSAPAPAGIDVRRWLRAAESVGKNPGFSSFDLSEVNPRYDVDGRTARLAALTVWTVLRGLCQRLAPSL